MGQEEKEDSRIKRCILLVKKMNEKMHYYENELRKSECEVECDNVDWIDLCSDMFSLLEEVKEELLVNPTLFETPESIELTNREIQDAELNRFDTVEFINCFIKGAWWALTRFNIK